MKTAGYIGLVILQCGLLSVAAPVLNAQPKAQNQHKTASSTHGRAKDSTQWVADPLRGWVPTETRHEEKEKNSAIKQGQGPRNRARAKNGTNKS